ncbi:MAG: hypothetical protein IPH55_00005 [Betaproteobacteria bacterium]|nr:hypothetical protein [Betaproteobacteria bacterium]
MKTTDAPRAALSRVKATLAAALTTCLTVTAGAAQPTANHAEPTSLSERLQALTLDPLGEDPSDAVAGCLRKWRWAPNLAYVDVRPILPVRPPCTT